MSADEPDATTRWRTIKTLLDAALDLDPSGRDAFLEDTCGGDAALRREVEALLEADAAVPSFLDEGAVAFSLPLLPDVPEPSPPERVGPYRIVRELGRGGMGVVYLAERADGHFEQRVALKLLRGGLGADGLTRRFLAERQIMASLSHPNIARLLDGGVTGDGQPYFVMEYVEGRPITEYCDEERLPVPARLALFEQVAEAIAYAHRHLVVHRDLKPSNILVTGGGEEGEPRVKLLDFGIARLLDADGDRTVTRLGLHPMTPAWASPEQIRGEAVTTASDVYQLGLLLYALLTGQHAYDVEARSPSQVERVVCEQEPARPSTTVANPAEAEEAGRERATRPERLRRQLAGDLDTICLKALRKEPERRYASAEALAADVRRHLDGLPVEARPESVTYRMGKFVRRNRVLVAAAVITLLAIVTGAGMAMQQAAEAERQREVAAREAATSQQVAAFMTDLFQEANSAEVAGDTVSAREMLDRGFARIDSLGRTPDVQASLLETLGGIYSQLGRFEKAAEAFERVIGIRRGQGDALAAALALGELADVYFSSRGFPQAIETYRTALAEAEGAAAPDTLRASLYLRLGEAFVQNGEFGEAIRALDVADSLMGRARRTDSGLELSIRALRAKVLVRQEDYEGARRLYEQNILQRRALGQESALARELNDLGFALKFSGDAAGALVAYREALEIEERMDREGHRNRSVLLSNIAAAAFEIRDFKTGQAALLKKLDLETTFQPAGHWRIGSAHGALASFYRAFERPRQALPHHRQEVATYAAALGPEHPWTTIARVSLALTLLQTGADEDAQRDLTAAAAALRRFHAGGDSLNHATRQNLERLVQALDEGGYAVWAATFRAFVAPEPLR